MTPAQERLGLRQARALVPAPQFHVHPPVVPPRVRLREEGPVLPRQIGLDPAQKQVVPLVEVDEDVAHVLVAGPVGALPALDLEDEGGLPLHRVQGVDDPGEAVEPRLRRVDQLRLGRRSRHRNHLPLGSSWHRGSIPFHCRPGGRRHAIALLTARSPDNTPEQYRGRAIETRDNLNPQTITSYAIKRTPGNGHACRTANASSAPTKNSMGGRRTRALVLLTCRAQRKPVG